MIWTVNPTHDFAAEAKRLSKKYHGFKKDLEDFKNSLIKNPFQGVELTPGIRKIRIAITAKGKGKSGGGRVITLTYYISEDEGEIIPLLIYDKLQADTVDVKVVRHIAKEVGYDLEKLEKEGKLKVREKD